METFPEAETPGVLRNQVREMQEQAWPSTEHGSPVDLGPVHDPALRPMSMLLIEEDTVLCALDVLFKQIVHAGQELSSAGLSTVVTPRAHRGRGHEQPERLHVHLSASGQLCGPCRHRSEHDRSSGVGLDEPSPGAHGTEEKRAGREFRTDRLSSCRTDGPRRSAVAGLFVDASASLLRYPTRRVPCPVWAATPEA